MNTIDIDFLKKVFNRVIEKLEFEEVHSIKIEDDLYNKIPAHKWAIQHNTAEVVVIGSLSDDIESLKELINDEDGFCTYVDFDRLASVLMAISEIRNPVE